NWLAEYPFIRDLGIVAGVLILSWIVYIITKRYLLRLLAKMVQKSKTSIDDIILENVVARRLSYIAPILVIYNFAYLLPAYETVIQQVLFALMVWVILLSMGALLNHVHLFLQRMPAFKDKPVKSYVQVVKMVMYIFGTIFVIGLLTGTSPWALVSGLGAMTAVLLLIFRDTILSFVASLQINNYDLVKVGDWIEVPKYGADGDVIDIALHTIKVQNWDKTITTIPTHKLIEESFKNWRGMQQSGGRRIKRAVHLDISSVKFCSQEMIDKFKRIHVLKDYIERKTEELERYNRERGIDASVLVNGRRMTNLGVFRSYVEAYLRNHDKINQNLTFLIRQLAPGPTGIPIEIYVFANDIAWRNYEAIQADIFDHILAVVPEFSLRVFQNPSGGDIEKINFSPAVTHSNDHP
nr:mechanosensitive ion channel [Calditrichia bacterium]NIV71668.1 mechanosensitive ion channel [Calditrichia bacterium]NIW00234.1 mechanosensitive ion channel [Candidatus Saccharibacteria bacterium]